jgi:hypothetical protein
MRESHRPHHQGAFRIVRVLAVGFSVAISMTLAGGALSPPPGAALLEGDNHADLLIGADDDNIDNPTIQPPGTVANQSLNNADVLVGEGGNDVLIGLLGSDVLRGGQGDDILIGGPEQGSQPNSDIIFGDDGKDINIWAPGDGSDAFLGGRGRDVQIFGVIDKDVNNVPLLTGPVPGYPQGVPTANVSGQGGFCRIEPAEPGSGYDFLVRFIVRATGAIAVTVRLKDVEDLICTSEAGGEIVYADLTAENPEFRVVTVGELARDVNRTLAHIIR